MQHAGTTITFKELIHLQRYCKKIQTPARANHASMGTHLAHQRGRGMDFDSVRLYQPGDDIRHIDWNVTARTTKVHTKLFCEEREHPVLLLLDLSPSLFFGTRNVFKSVLASQTAALIAWGALANGDRVGGIVQTHKQSYWFKPKLRQQGVVPLLKRLSLASAEHPKKSNKNLSDLLQKVHSLTRSSASLYLVSDFYSLDDQSLALLKTLANTYLLTLCFIYDPLEQNAPPPNYYRFSDGANSHLLNLHDPETRQRFEHSFKQRYLKCQHFCRKHNVKLIELGTHENLKDSLIRYL